MFLGWNLVPPQQKEVPKLIKHEVSTHDTFSHQRLGYREKIC